MSISALLRAAVSCAALSLLPLAAHAGDTHPYTQAEFDRLTEAGKPVVLAVHADWCPTCKAQKPILSKLLAKPAYRDVTMLTIDFDHSKPLLQKLHVATQSTLIGYRGTHEVARTVGDTTEQGIDALLAKTAG